MQDTPIGRGNRLPTSRIIFGKCVFVERDLHGFKRMLQHTTFVYMYRPKCYYQHDRMVREITSWFRQTRGPGIVFCYQNSLFVRVPHFSSYFMVDSFLCES